MIETKTLQLQRISDEEDQKMGSLDSDDDNDGNDNNPTKGDKIYSVVINGTKQNFMFSDLIRFEYFRNYLSNRWKHGDEIKVELDDRRFNVKELKTIIDCKKYQQIHNNYDFSRMQNLINALDYFQETIDHNIFYQYLLSYIPLIRPNQINIICHANNKNENEDEQYDPQPMKEFSKATKMYKDLYSNSRMNLAEKFINNWETMAIATIGKMRNVTYLILMKTLKLIKTESTSNHSSAKWYDRDCEISIKFMKERSLEDFNHLWNVMLQYDKETYLINILLTIIGQYSGKSELEYWENYSRNGIYYKNEYKRVDYEDNIRDICGHMIIHVAERIFFDSINCVQELKHIISEYVQAIQTDKELVNPRNSINKFYDLLTDAYFTNTASIFRESIEILFQTECFNATLLTKKYANTSDAEKNLFLMSMLKSMKNYDTNNENIYRFFMRRSKGQMLQTIKALLDEDETVLNMTNMTYSLLNSCVAFFKKLLEAEGDTETLEKLHFLLIDEKLFKYVKNDHILALILDICDDDSINRRFTKLDGEKINFLKYLLTQLTNEKVDWKQKRLTELTKFLLDENMNETLQIFDVWFPIFVVKEKHWIIHKMVNNRYPLWNVIANSHHINHLFNIILTTINEYLPNSKSSDIYDNIKMVCCHLIISVAERIFYGEIHYVDYGEELKGIIQIFLKVICSRNGPKYAESLMNQFYIRLIVAYFRYTHYTFDESIEILFEPSLFKPKKLKEIYLNLLTNYQKHTFLQNMFKSITSDNTKFENIYRFFMRMNKHESLQYILQNLLNTNTQIHLFLFVKLFKEALEEDNDTKMLDTLYTFLINEQLFKFVQNDQLLILILDVCDADNINNRFVKLRKKIDFLKYLLTKTSMNKELAIKQKKLAKSLLDRNKNEALEIWNIWFPIFMIEEQDWIIQEMFNEKSLSFAKMEEILDIVSDLLINDENGTVPQTYFDFIDKYTTDHQ